MANSLREAIEVLERVGLVLRIKNELSTMYEIPFIVSKLEREKALLFENIEGYKDFKITFGVYGDRKRLALTLELESETEIYTRLLDAMNNPSKPTK